jgi:hypothetical protein
MVCSRSAKQFDMTSFDHLFVGKEWNWINKP